MESSISIGTDASGPFKNEMSYKPGVMGDTASRACAGKTWSIPAVTITGQGGSGPSKPEGPYVRMEGHYVRFSIRARQARMPPDRLCAS